MRHIADVRTRVRYGSGYGTLRSALEELRGQDLASLGDVELVADLDELERTSRMIEAERSRRLAELERRGAFAGDGCLSLTAWLVARHRVPASAAAGRVRLARALERMPLVAESLASGEIDPAAAGLLASAYETCPEAFGQLEEVLVDAARALGIADLRRVVERFRQAADLERAEREEDHRYRRLYVSPTLDGMVRVDGDLDAETGQALISSLRAVMDADARTRSAPDRRTPAQRRADALGGICRAWLERADHRWWPVSARTSWSRWTSTPCGAWPERPSSRTPDRSRPRPRDAWRATRG